MGLFPFFGLFSSCSPFSKPPKPSPSLSKTVTALESRAIFGLALEDSEPVFATVGLVTVSNGCPVVELALVVPTITDTVPKLCTII